MAANFSQFIWDTLRLDSIRTESRLVQINFWHDELTTGETIHVDLIESSRIKQHFQPTLHSPPEVRIHGIMIHESSSFLQCGNKLQSICISYFTTRLDSHGVMSRANQLRACWINNGKWFVSIQSNWVESTTFLPTLHSPPEVKIRGIMIHEPFSFLKRGHKLQLTCTIHVDSI